MMDNSENENIHKSIPLLDVQVPGNGKASAISIKLTPATPSHSSIGTHSSLATEAELVTFITDRSGSNESLRPKRKLAQPCNLERVNIGDTDELTVQGFVHSMSKSLLFYFGVICTFGMLLLYAEWQPELKLKLTHQTCALEDANILLLKDTHGNVYIEKVKKPIEVSEKGQLTYFFHKKIKYIWHPDQQQFLKLIGLESQKCGVIYSYTSGLSKQEAKAKFELYGPNAIDIDVKPVWKIVYDEMRTPFYMYQVFIIFFWCLQSYYQFSLCVAAFSAGSISLHAYETRKQSRGLKQKMQSEGEVTVVRNSSAKLISSRQLVPGDLLIINKPCHLCCDAVLVDGGSCIVNEAMLTGECVPITKTSLVHKPDLLYSANTNKKNTLYCGTEIVQVHPSESGHAKAIVVRTGFSTAKGELVRGILYPKESTTQLHAEMLKCMKMFFALGIPCMFYTACVFYNYQVPMFDLVIIVIDIVTFLVPPLLPSVITSVNVHAQKRLMKEHIFCLQSSQINACGSVEVICFDKTGTLTHDSLDFAGILPLKAHPRLPTSLREIKEPIGPTTFSTLTPPDDLRSLPLDTLQMCIATCHSLIQLDNRLQGDPLEQRLFQQLSCWNLLGPEESERLRPHFMRTPERVLQRQMDSSELSLVGIMRKSSDPQGETKNAATLNAAILHQIPFESALQRMAVIVQITILPNINSRRASVDASVNLLNPIVSLPTPSSLLVLMKGAPETIASLCTSDSLPADFSSQLKKYMSQGYRVLACASRVLSCEAENINKLSLNEIENGLRFDGLLLFHNQVKQCSPATIAELHRVQLRSVMVTGDSLFTAVHVARECGIAREGRQLIQLKVELADGKMNDNRSSCNSWVELRESECAMNGEIGKQLQVTYNQLAREHEPRNDCQIEISKQKTSIEYVNKVLWNRNIEKAFAYELAIDGRSYEMLQRHSPELLNRVLDRGVVFARMSPSQKQHLISALQAQGHQVAMVGDGANDCAALRQANCGLSLSGEQSAMAAAFSTPSGSVSSLLPLLTEGRAALAATCGAFKYQVSYCFLLLSTVMLLFWDGVFNSDGAYVMIDIVLNVTPPLLFGTTKAARKLHVRAPSGRLCSWRSLLSIFSFVIIQSMLYIFVQSLVRHQPWYEQPLINPLAIKRTEASYLALSVLSVNMISYVIAAIIFAPGAPHRRSLASNRLYLSVVSLNLIIVLSFLIWPASPSMLAYVNFRDVPDFRFKLLLLALSAVNFFISYVWERLFLQQVLPALIARHRKKYRVTRPQKPYQQLQVNLLQMQRSGEWPPALLIRC